MRNSAGDYFRKIRVQLRVQVSVSAMIFGSEQKLDAASNFLSKTVHAFKYL